LNKSKPNLKIKIFADGAQKEQMLGLYRQGLVSGFTTNPTLMAKAGITDYAAFAKDILQEITTMPISFEVFSDEFDEMEKQAEIIDSWGRNVNVKIPISNTKGQSAIPLIRRLLDKGIKLNVTALFTDAQLMALKEVVAKNDDVIVSIFAGRIADSGRDPEPIMRSAVEAFSALPNSKVLWASSREAFNIYQAERCGCQIITATPDLVNKLDLFNKDLEEFSLETVKMFYNDATKAGFKI